jgi:nucleoside-diphosphate-sugar epimerase
MDRAGASRTVDELVLIDRSFAGADFTRDPRVIRIEGDITGSEFASRVVGEGIDTVFHLAAAVSAEAEVDADAAFRINVTGTRSLLDALQAGAADRARVVFASSIAVFGPSAERAADDIKQTPASTYGMTKAVGELLINDYTRKGWIDGRTARLPTVVVRPGAPNRAASGFISAIVRQVALGRPYALPVDIDTPIAVIGLDEAVRGLIALHDADGHRLGLDRAVSFPAITVTAREVLDLMDERFRLPSRGLITVEIDRLSQSIVESWPARGDGTRALELFWRGHDSLEAIIERYLVAKPAADPDRL